MEILVIIALIIAGILLFAVEIFLIPGIGLAGVASAVSLIYAVYYTFDTQGTQAGFITMAGIAVGVVGVIVWFMRSRTVERLSLKRTLDYKPEPLKGKNIQVGDEGTSLTRLTLIGNAEIKGHILEVQSADGFIDERTPIQVCRIDDGTVYVQRAQR